MASAPNAQTACYQAQTEFFETPAVQGALVGVTGVLVGLLVNWLILLWQRGQVRKSVVTAIRSDIRSIVQAMEMTGVVNSFIKTYKSPEDKPQLPPWSDAPREENYFKLYEAMAPQLGTVSPVLAREIVRFYTYLRISRDAAAPFAELRNEILPSGKHKAHAENVLVALREAFKSAQFVLSREYSSSNDNEDGLDAALAMINATEDAVKNNQAPNPALQRTAFRLR